MSTARKALGTVRADRTGEAAGGGPAESSSSSEIPDGGGGDGRVIELALPLSLCTSAVAVLLVALGYASARTGVGPAVPLFWSGQVMLLLAAAAVLLSPRQRRTALNTAVIVYSVGQWLIRLAYAPNRLEFSDELQHHRSAVEILRTGHLFPVNYSLPISSYYPGLEAVAVALNRLTGLDLFLCELLTTGVSHTLLAAALLVLLRVLTDDARAGALATLVYLVGSYSVFSTMFSYQTLALPVGILLIAQTLQLGRSRTWARRLALIAVLAALVVLTHHLTGFVLLVALLGLALGQTLYWRSWPAVRRTAAATLVYAAILAGWTLTAARSVVGYLGPPLQELLGGASSPEPPGGGAPPGAGQPLIERAFTYGAILVPLMGLSLAVLLAWSRGHRGIATLSATAVAVQLAVIAMRFVASDGTELAGRAFAFTALLNSAAISAVVAAVGDGRLIRRGRHSAVAGPLLRLRVRLAAGLVLVVLAVGGTTAGWPPRYERLPTYQVAGYESAMDRHTVEAAQWADRALPPGTRIGSDFGNVAAFGTIGNQFPVRAAYPEVFTDPTSAAAARRVRENELQLLVVDSRLTQQLPPPDRGTWFNGDPHAGTYTRPLAPSTLTAFDRIPGVRRIFDDGTIRIYDVRESAYVTGGS